MGLVIFDLDGTLIETAPDLVGTLNAMLIEEGAEPLAYEKARNFVGQGARTMLQQGLEAAGVRNASARAEALTPDFISHYRRRIAHESRPFPGALAALDTLSAKGHTLAICTNKREDLARALFDTLGLTRRFATIVGGDSIGIAKPHAAPLLETVRRAGAIAPAVMVGDSASDVGAARNAGMPVIGVTFGYTMTPIEELAPDLVISHFDQLVDAVEKLFARQ